MKNYGLHQIKSSKNPAVLRDLEISAPQEEPKKEAGKTGSLPLLFLESVPASVQTIGEQLLPEFRQDMRDHFMHSLTHAMKLEVLSPVRSACVWP